MLAAEIPAGCITRRLTSRARMISFAMLVGAALVVASSVVRAQDAHRALIQIEVGDSIGLPLPDATVEVFTILEGGIFREWVDVDGAELPAGIHLLRFSHPGYRPAVFSVPLRNDGTVSLRVRLDPERDTTQRQHAFEATGVHAIGLAFAGRMRTDIIGSRRIINGRSLERETVLHFGELMRRARNTGLTVKPARGGRLTVYGESGAGGQRCLDVMVNGDRRHNLPFDTFDQLFGMHDVEAVEIFPRSNGVPIGYLPPGGRCAMMLVWFRTL